MPSCVRKIKIDGSNSVEHRVGYSRLVKVVEEEFGCFEKAAVTVFDGEDDVAIKTFEEFALALEEQVESRSAKSSAVIVNVKQHTSSFARESSKKGEEEIFQHQENDFADAGGSASALSGAESEIIGVCEKPRSEASKRSLPEDTEGEGDIISICDWKTPAKKAKKDLNQKQLEELCEKANKQHLSNYGVMGCFSSTQEGIFCPFCCVTLKTDGFGISNVQQKITAHCERVCH